MTETFHRNFTVIEAAQHLRISRAMIYKLIASKQLRPFKIGTRTLFAAAELDRFVQYAQHVA